MAFVAASITGHAKTRMVSNVAAISIGARALRRMNAAGRVGGARTEDARDGLGDGFVGGEAIAAFADVMAETLGVPMFDGREEPQPAVIHSPDFRAVGGPAHVGGVGGGAAVVPSATRNQKPQDMIFSLVSCVVR